MKKKIAAAGIGAMLLCGVVIRPEYLYAQEAAEDTIELNWMIYGDKYKVSEEIQECFNEKLHEYYPDISVSLDIVSKDDYKQTWDMKMAANEAVDIAWIGSEVVSFTEEVKKGSFMALDYLLSEYGENLQETISEELWKKQSRDDNIYGIPVLGPLYRKNYVLKTNKDLMERYGDFDEIITTNQKNLYTTAECFEVMEPFLEKIKENNALGTGVSYQSLCSIADKGLEGLYGEESPFVIRIFDETPVVYNKYELESYSSCFEIMADWYQKGYIREDVAYLLDPSSEDGKRSGNILYVEEYGENASVYDTVDAEYDVLSGELDGYRFISYDTSRNCLVIPKTARHPQEAVQLIDFLHSEEGQALYRLLVNGREKEEYIPIEEGSEVIARMTDENREYCYGLSPVTIGNIFQNFELDEQQFETIEKYNADALRSPLEGFELDTRMIAIQLKKIDLIVDEYKEKLCQGICEDWETVYETFLEEMREAGSESVIEEMQRQINEFME